MGAKMQKMGTDLFSATTAANKEHEFAQSVANRNQRTGSNRFIDEIESGIGIRVAYWGLGRPTKCPAK